MLAYEHKHWSSGKEYLAGIDEAGRGLLAGPVHISQTNYIGHIILRL